MGPEDLQRLSGLMERWELPAQRDLTKIIPVCTETPVATLSLAAKSWAHPRLAGGLNAYSPRSTPALQAWCRSSNAGRAPAPDVTGKPHMAKIAQLFSICSQEFMMGHPS